MKKIFYFTFSIITVSIVFLGIQLFVPKTSINANSVWKEIGKGNLKAVEEDGKWKLYPVSATYLNMLGVDGKETQLLSQDVYEVDNSNCDILPPPTLTLRGGGFLGRTN